MRGSRRLDGVPEYLSTRLMRTVAEARARGVDVISLGIGDPDTPPPAELREELGAQARRDDIARLPDQPRHRAAARGRRRRTTAARFGVELDPEREVLPLLGAKEGLAHLCLAQLDPGDVALVADPGYPVYYGGPALAGGEAVGLPLRAENGFLPDLDAVAGARRRAARNLLICGYPNNPTGAVADVAFFERLAAWGAQRGVPICHDNAYAELTYDGFVAPSFLAAPGAREAGIEIYSLSKSLSTARLAHGVRGRQRRAGRRACARSRRTSTPACGWRCSTPRSVPSSCVPSFTAGLRELYGRRRDVALRRPRRASAWSSCARAARSTCGCACRAAAARWRSPSACSSEAPSSSGPGAAYGPTSDGLRAALADRAGGAPRRGGRAHRRACSDAGRAAARRRRRALRMLQAWARARR